MAKTVEKDNQNFEINIDSIYSSFIRAIDSFRSTINISDNNNLKILSNIDENIFKGSFKESDGFKPETTPQESRCHAFYRMIGFPVLSDDNRIYNPGFDIILEEGRAITVEKKIEIAKNPPKGFNDISNFRENYFKDSLNIFSVPDSTDAGVLALSILNNRNFNSSFIKNTDSIESKFDKNNQSYDVNLTNIIGKNRLGLKEFLDKNNKKADEKTISFIQKRYHIIKPFIVDARIDVSAPSVNKVAVPFVKTSDQLKINSKLSVKRPLLEKIIIDRFILSNDLKQISDTLSQTINDIKNIEMIKDLDILNKISSGDLYGLSEKLVFIENINLIRAMIEELYIAKKTVQKVQSEYYYLPLCSRIGPEQISNNMHDVFQNLYYKTAGSNFYTENDKSIIVINLKKLTSKLQAEAVKTEKIPNLNNYAFNEFFSITFDPQKEEAYGNTVENQLQKLIEKRSKSIKEANEALRKIEIITGEISGFGLCDIIAIMGGLYLMPKESLLGFLDEDAYKRAKLIIKSLPSNNPKTINDALKDLTDNVKNMYDIMQKLAK